MRLAFQQNSPGTIPKIIKTFTRGLLAEERRVLVESFYAFQKVNVRLLSRDEAFKPSYTLTKTHPVDILFVARSLMAIS